MTLEEKNIKKPYTLSCSSEFRDRIMTLAQEKKVNVGDCARSIFLLLPWDVIESYPDPGEPSRDDREEVHIRAGQTRGRLWRRKPRLQVRLMENVDPKMIRRALQLFYDLCSRRVHLRLVTDHSSAGDSTAVVANLHKAAVAAAGSLQEKNRNQEALEAAGALRKVQELFFKRHTLSVENLEEARDFMGFSKGELLDLLKIRQRRAFIENLYYEADKDSRPQESYLEKLLYAQGLLSGATLSRRS